MNDTAPDSTDAAPDLALLAASGLLPEDWARPPAAPRSPHPTPGAGATGPPVAADHKSYLPDLVAEPSWSAIEAGALLGVEPDTAPRALDWLRRAGVVIGLPRATATVYPRFQFDSVGRRVRRVVAVVNVWLGTAGDPYSAAVWWLRPGPDGARPRDLLGTPDEPKVIAGAAAHISRRVLGAYPGLAPGPAGRHVIGGQPSLDPVPVPPPEASEPAPVPAAGPAPDPADAIPIEPLPRAGIFGRHPRHA